MKDDEMLLTGKKARSSRRAERQKSALRIDVGEEVEDLVQRRKDKYGETFREALRVIAKKNPKLHKKWQTGKGSGVYKDTSNLGRLARFLNHGLKPNHTPNKTQQELIEIMVPLVNWAPKQTEVREAEARKAASRLAEKLRGLTVDCHVEFPPKKRPSFYCMTGGYGLNSYYGIIFNALQDEYRYALQKKPGNVSATKYRPLSQLKQCKYCNNFFVDADARQKHCPRKQCQSEKRKNDAKEGAQAKRYAKRTEKLERAKELIANIREKNVALRHMDASRALLKKIEKGIADRLSDKSIAESLSHQQLNWMAKIII